MAEKLPPENKPISIAGEEEPIRLVDDGEKPAGAAPAAPSMRALGDAGIGGGRKLHAFKRSMNATGQGATRFRLFRSKVAASSLENLEHQINEWLDGDQVEVKQVGHVIGTMEGKMPEPNLLVMIWY